MNKPQKPSLPEHAESYRQIRIKQFLAKYTAPFIFAVAYIYFVYITITTGKDVERDSIELIKFLAGIFVLYTTVTAMISFFIYDELRQVEWIDSHLCNKLMHACMANDEVEAYRQLVLKEGRPFTYSEYNQMMQFNKKMKDYLECLEEYNRLTSDCKRLYSA